MVITEVETMGEETMEVEITEEEIMEATTRGHQSTLLNDLFGVQFPLK